MRTTLGIVFSLGALGGAWLFACGSSDDKPIPAPENGGTDGSITVDGSGPGSEGGVTPGTDGSSTLDGTTTTDAPVVNTDPDGGTTTEAGPGGTTTSITCGATSCAIPGSVCCVYDNNGAPTFTFTCVTATDGGCPQVNGTNDHPPALSCTSFANCNPGDVCCVTLNNNDDVSSTCVPAAQCENGDTAVLCDPSAPDGGGCPPADPCDNNNINDWNLPRGFGTCGGKGN
jgi:hypothetical protein